jgi:hypothetical protein
MREHRRNSLLEQHEVATVADLIKGPYFCTPAERIVTARRITGSHMGIDLQASSWNSVLVALFAHPDYIWPGHTHESS